MAFCRFCGKELVNGQCDCDAFQQAIGNSAPVNNVGNTNVSANIPNPQYQQAYQQSARDPFLIPRFNLNFTSFSSFITSIRDQSGMSEPNSTHNDPFEHNIPIVPDCIEPEENEIIVKQYNIAKLRTRLKFMKAEGRLMVTNRRVLFRAAGTSLTGNILQEHQFDLNEIGGIEMHKDYKFSFLSFFGCILLETLAMYLSIAVLSTTGNAGTTAIGLIMGLLCLLPTFIVYKRFWLKYFSAMLASAFFALAYFAADGNGFMLFLLVISSLIVLMDMIIVCFVPNLVIKIKTNGARGAVVIGCQKAMFLRKTGDDYSGFAEVMPWEDTIMAINELGTMIDDLQKQGDNAIDKWSK
jgi:hypothetical protein